MVIDVRT